MPPGFPPAVIVHGLPDVQSCRALARPVTFLSAPWAGVYAGAGWWRALMASAGAPAHHILDCGDAPGRALEALRLGQPCLVLRAAPEVWTDVADRAARSGAALLAAPPPALDLAAPGAARRLPAWLSNGA